MLNPRRHGFLLGRSTITAKHIFLSDVICPLEEGVQPVGIFHDLSRAFDCINHNILIEVMESFGVRGVVRE